MEVWIPRRLERLTCGLLTDESDGEKKSSIDVLCGTCQRHHWFRMLVLRSKEMTSTLLDLILLHVVFKKNEVAFLLALWKSSRRLN